MNQLPIEFECRMRKMLGKEYDAFEQSYDESRQYGLRVNALKCAAENFEKITPCELEHIPWVSNGFYYSSAARPAVHPYYAAGVYYLQEPSAMTPAGRLPILPGERVLDLCAAPGGKATELAARLQGEGILVANDISAARAKTLLYNLEVSGVTNAFVTNELPGNLAQAFHGWFDKVLVDAPCSGEGMFRKNPEVLKTWTPERPLYFAKIQRDIVANAVEMLRDGGSMLYSTCTFSPEENEGTISWLLEQFPQMELVEIEPYEGFRPGNPQWGDGNKELKKCVRIWPQCMDGEGHFLALLKKTSKKTTLDTQETSGRLELQVRQKPDKEEKRLLETFLQSMQITLELERVDVRKGKAYLTPDLPGSVRSLRFLRNGLYLGEYRKNRFEPSQAFAMALSAETCGQVISFSPEDERIGRYLRGETIAAGEQGDQMENGWKLICVDQFSLGWGKLLNGVIKNKYLSAWRKN
ncbi:MAG: RsmB/NOP family class I SAM-dependent RNA methyltransferase [Lachnospiraceae bacterium]|nr:RsmB/NOP family class I SAM-dependent RNA methyltransferase [Lachnospiraceae bacterium]